VVALLLVHVISQFIHEALSELRSDELQLEVEGGLVVVLGWGVAVKHSQLLDGS